MADAAGTDETRAGPAGLMRLDPANSLLPYGQPLADYLDGEVGIAYLKRLRAWHAAAEFAAPLCWDSLILALGPTPLVGDGPGITTETLDLIALAGAVRRPPESSPAPPPELESVLPVPAEPGFVDGPETRTAAPPGAPPRQERTLEERGPAGIQLPQRMAEPLRPRMAFGQPPAPAALPEPPGPETPRLAKPIHKQEVRLPERAQDPDEGLDEKPAPRPTLVAPPKPASTVKPVPVPMPKPAAPRPAVLPRPLKGSPAPAVLPSVAAEKAPDPEKAGAESTLPPPPPAPRPTLVPDRKVVEIESVARPQPHAGAPAEPLPVPSFGGAVAAGGPSLSLTGEALRAEQVVVPSVLPGLLKVAVPLLLVVGGGVYYFLTNSPAAPHPGRAPGAAAEAGTLIEQGWVTEWASDPGGSRRGRQLTIFKPSLKLADYHFVFSGRIETRALGWVIRASDTRNYYAMKIVQEPSGVVFTRWAVVDGRESSYSEKRLAVTAGTFQVQVDAKGPRFAVSIQGEPVEVWTDNRLAAGAVGFMNEREERGRTSTVQLKFAKRAAGG